MLWKLLTPDQWSALGTVVSAIAAVLNLIVVVVLLVYTRAATRSAEAQAAVALHTLSALREEKKRQNGLALMEADARLKDLGQMLLVLEGATRHVSFAPKEWKAKPDDWHKIADVVGAFWPEGIQKLTLLEAQLREIDFDLQALAHLPVTDEAHMAGIAHLKDGSQKAHALAREIWEGMMLSA